MLNTQFYSEFYAKRKSPELLSFFLKNQRKADGLTDMLAEARR
jgi:hypothetical protein